MPTFDQLPPDTRYTIHDRPGATVYRVRPNGYTGEDYEGARLFRPHAPTMCQCYPVPVPAPRPLPRTAQPIFPPALLMFYKQPSTTALRTANISPERVLETTGLAVIACEDCDQPTLEQELDHAGRCEDCAANYTTCEYCGDEAHGDDTYCVSGDRTYCQTCTDRHTFSCGYCDDLTADDGDCSIYSEDDGYVCGHCADHHYHYCEGCDTYSRDTCDCNQGCDCEAPHQHFTFPANGKGTVQQDERTTVTLPTGTVDGEGLQCIRALIYNEMAYVHASIMDTLEPEWQTRRGNMTRRIASAIYKLDGTKVPPALLTKIGNIARQHSAEQSTYHVEFTRDLNRPAEEFANEDSCWWESYYRSRCSLKSWGGLAIRSYPNEDHYSHDPSGRAWIQPLTKDLTPTADTTGAHAFLVYNGYGDLEGYAAARIVAHLTGKTYRKIHVPSRGEDWYVNSNTGYLIADPATTAKTDSLSFPYDHHYTPPTKEDA